MPVFSLFCLIVWNESQVQEAADCLGADCVPRYVETKRLIELEIEDAFQAKQKVDRTMIFFLLNYTNVIILLSSR